MKPLEIIKKYYKPGSKAYKILIEHSEAVKNKALDLAKNLDKISPDLDFISEAAMLHDIGVFKTNSPKIGCDGDELYIKHGVIGGEILENEGLRAHARVCERHIGVGITKDDIKKQNLPLPERDMTPQTIEEEIICLADKFFSKSKPNKEESVDQIKNELKKYGEDKVNKFEELLSKYTKQ